jgi:hypothetical protein
MLSAIIAALIALFATLADQPAPAQTSPAPAVVAPVPAPGVSPSAGGDSAPILPGVSGTQPGPAPQTVVDPADAGCAPGEEWDGLRCVAVQLPGETIGRAID